MAFEALQIGVGPDEGLVGVEVLDDEVWGEGGGEGEV